MPTDREIANNLLELRQAQCDAARIRFANFLQYTQPTYSRQWFHTLIAERCQALLQGTLGKSKLMIFMPPQHGKLLSDDTPVHTPHGIKRHGDLKVGDYVFGRNGQPVIVQAVSKKAQCEYTITFTTGEQIQCHGRHEWVVFDRNRNRWTTMETRDIAKLRLEVGVSKRRGHRYMVQVDQPRCVNYAHREVLIDPYTLGVWLGDGKSSEPVIHIGNNDTEIIDALPYEVMEGKGTTDRVFYMHGQRANFRRYDLLNNKHIPEDYIFNDQNTRLQLIAGLIDTDGYVYAKNGRVTISNCNEDVIEGAARILRSLGQNPVVCAFEPTTSSSGIHGKKTCFQLCFNPTVVIPTRVPRKKITLLVNGRRRAIVKIERKEGLGYGNCIQVEGGVYLAGDTLIPTHNSEIVSRKFPAWALGVNPRLKIVGSSYSADLAQQFSRSIQRTIDSPEYREVFPDTYLNGQGLAADQKGYIRNVDFFETVGNGGFYKAVGVGGSLTGTPVDIGIIDDPVKDALEASSTTYRNRIWEWYTDVFLTRLHNNSKQLLIMTRWHVDDLAGRLLDREGDTWDVVKIPAICEAPTDGDPRQIGEALWPDRHSTNRLLEVESRSPRTFAALYQQRPTIDGGNIIKREWFSHVTAAEFNRIHKDEPIVYFLDTAYTDKTTNDPTGIIATCKIGEDMYITHGEKVNMKFPDLLRFIPEYVKRHGYSRKSSIRIEPKANGLSVIDQLREVTGLNVTRTPSPRDSKETRLNAASPTVECGRVVLVDGAWNEAFISEVCGFPAMPHDEYVDVLCYAVDYHLENPFKPIDKSKLARTIY